MFKYNVNARPQQQTDKGNNMSAELLRWPYNEEK